MKISLQSTVKSLQLCLAIFVFGIFGLMIDSCNSGPKKPVSNEPINQSGLAKYKFTEEIHDFGPVQAGEIVSFTFICRNEGTKALTITNVDSGCGCIEVKITNKTIEPGQEGQIEVIYNSAGEVGKQLKTITLFSNADEPEKQLFIKANTNNDIIEINS